MKTYKHLFEQSLDTYTILKSTLDAAEHKLRRSEVLNALVDFDRTHDLVVEAATNPDYRPCEDNTHEIIDGANHKKREIEKPMFCPEQILHHMIIEPFAPVLLRGLYEQVYGCLPPSVVRDKHGNVVLCGACGRVSVRKYGPLAATKQLKKWLQNGKKAYCAELDIHHAYGSVHIPTLAAQMERVIHDADWLRLTFKFLHYRKGDPECDDLYGLTLGHYTSPWFFNFYLKEFDHFAAAQAGVKYLRYADNLFLVGGNKRKVHAAVRAIADYLRRELRLELNGSTQVYRFEYPDARTGRVRGRAMNALGTVIHFNRATLRKSILLRIRRKARRIRRKAARRLTWHDAASMLSRLAWIRHTDTFTYYLAHIKPCINARQLKERLRAYCRKQLPIITERRELIYDRLEKSNRLAERKAAGVRHGQQPHYRLSAS